MEPKLVKALDNWMEESERAGYGFRVFHYHKHEKTQKNLGVMMKADAFLELESENYEVKFFGNLATVETPIEYFRFNLEVVPRDSVGNKATLFTKLSAPEWSLLYEADSYIGDTFYQVPGMPPGLEVETRTMRRVLAFLDKNPNFRNSVSIFYRELDTYQSNVLVQRDYWKAVFMKNSSYLWTSILSSI